MYQRDKHQISILGEFKDKDLEIEFIDYDIKRSLKALGPLALMFGFFFMLFILVDYHSISNKFGLMGAMLIRFLVLFMSISSYFYSKKIKDSTIAIILINLYKILTLIGFFIIVYVYDSLTLLFFLDVMILVVATYIIPNKIRYAQYISIALTLVSLFLFFIKADELYGLVIGRLISYSLIVLVFCNIGAFLTNYYKRRQFADSKELQRMSHTDPLTGIYNRVKFNSEIEKWVYCAKKSNFSLSIVMIDIDNFKGVNDRFGHLVGDKVLQKITSTISGAIRSTDVFARWGGEEFILLLPRTTEKQAIEIVERIQELNKENVLTEVGIVTCSFGIASLRENENIESFLTRADNLLYKAKELGKNTFAYESMA